MNKSTRANKRRLKLPEWMPGWLKMLFRVSYRFAIICSVIFLIVALYYYYLASQYDLDEVAEITQPNLILTQEGTKLATLGSDTSKLVTFSEIPTHLIDALLTREDTRFHDHIGIDIRGLARATLKNISTMSYHEGASTISMQLTKNTYDNKSKSIHRKFLEIALTLRLESRYDKDQILTHYLNRIYFGSGSYGIEEAANTYFGVSTSQLTLGQSALIVGIIRGPHIFSPFNNIEAAIAQRDQVLERMAVIGKITEEEKTAAKEAPLNLADKGNKKSNSSYAISSIRRHQQQIIDTSKITEGGLHITSTINGKLTAKVTSDIKNLTSNINKNNDTPLQIAVVILENETGAIRTIIGGSDYKTSPYNRALDSKQQLGSAFYPFIYLAVLDRGKIPLKDQPVISGQQIGAKDLLGYCSRFGITHKPAEDPRDLYRGDIYTTPLQLASAYSIIQNNGTLAESYFVENIISKNATKLFSNTPYEKNTVSSGPAINCLKMLTKNKSNKQSIQLIATPYKHLWIVHSNTTHTAVVWVGHDLPKTIPNKTILSKNLQFMISQWLTVIKQ